MNIDGLFHSPGDRIAAFADSLLHLYRNDPSLQDYFMMLQADRWTGPRVSSRSSSASDRFVGSAIHVADKVNQFRGHPRLKADVLFCPMPHCDRKTETQFLIRSLLGLAQTEACLRMHLSVMSWTLNWPQWGAVARLHSSIHSRP
jgi:hypothetical protein